MSAQDNDETITFDVSASGLPRYTFVYVELVEKGFKYEDFLNTAGFDEDVVVEGSSTFAGEIHGMVANGGGSNGFPIPSNIHPDKLNYFMGYNTTTSFLDFKFVDGIVARPNGRLRMMDNNDFLLGEDDWNLDEAFIVRDPTISVDGVVQYPQLGNGDDRDTHEWDSGTDNDGVTTTNSASMDWLYFTGTTNFRADTTLLQKYKRSMLIPTLFDNRRVDGDDVSKSINNKFQSNNSYLMKYMYDNFLRDSGKLSVSYSNNHKGVPDQTYVNKAYMYSLADNSNGCVVFLASHVKDLTFTNDSLIITN
jgi:hypothetical protein